MELITHSIYIDINKKKMISKFSINFLFQNSFSIDEIIKLFNNFNNIIKYESKEILKKYSFLESNFLINPNFDSIVQHNKNLHCIFKAERFLTPAEEDKMTKIISKYPEADTVPYFFRSFEI